LNDNIICKQSFITSLFWWS